MKIYQKNLIYSLLITVSSVFCLLLGQSLKISIFTRLILIAVLIVIFNDKKYRKESIPQISNTLIIFGIALILFITWLQYALTFTSNELTLIVF